MLAARSQEGLYYAQALEEKGGWSWGRENAKPQRHVCKQHALMCSIERGNKMFAWNGALNRIDSITW